MKLTICFLLISALVCNAAINETKNILEEIIEEELSSLDENTLQTINWQSPESRLEFIIKILQKNPISRFHVYRDAQKLGFLTRSHKLSEPFTSFPCKTFTKNDLRGEAKNVNELTAADIDVVGAIGDSLSAGTGVDAKNILGLVNQYRGRVYSIGGDSTFESGNPTLVNILRKYNPNVKGFSIGQGKVDSANAGFNVAVPGHTSLNLVPQAQDLVSKMRSKLTEQEFQNSWKMVTIFLGNNDIGGFCKEDRKADFTPENYRKRLTETLDYLHANLPRTIVNVVKILDIFLVKELNIGLTCTTLHKYMAKCAAFPDDENAVVKINNDYQDSADEVVNSGDYFNDPNFTVVVQPFFQNTQLPKTSDNKVDLSYFAPDCFHFSGKGHASAALALWNSLFQSVGSKKTYWDATEGYECPDLNNPVIKTKNNS